MAKIHAMPEPRPTRPAMPPPPPSPPSEVPLLVSRLRGRLEANPHDDIALTLAAQLRMEEIKASALRRVGTAVAGGTALFAQALPLRTTPPRTGRQNSVRDEDLAMRATERLLSERDGRGALVPPAPIRAYESNTFQSAWNRRSNTKGANTLPRKKPRTNDVYYDHYEQDYDLNEQGQYSDRWTGSDDLY